MKTPGRVGGRYRIGELLARGGMANVHRGLDELLDRPVAVKLLRDDIAEEPSVRRRFRAEARRAASVRHPHVVAIYDVGTARGTPYIVMELIPGGDLADALATERPMNPRRAARIGAEVADALDAAHAAGVVHRDVKPRNILLDADGAARVADFGIARAMGDESLTRTGAMLGSVEYFSPEQARGEPATPASDVYALGIVLFELVTGRRPFTGDTPYSVATARLRQPPPDARAVNDLVPAELSAIIRRAMAAEPEDRYASAAKLRDALTGWLEAANREPRATPVPLAAGRPPPVDTHRGNAYRWMALIGVFVLLVAGYVGWRAAADSSAEPVSDRPDVVAGAPGGEVTTPEPTPSPIVTPTATPIPPTASPTLEPTPQATEAVAASTPTPAPAPTEAPAPAATSVAVAVANGPDDAVVAFYDRVAAGDFDAAYRLWSDRMKATYPREGNLDGRFAETASITFFELRVASQTADGATVQANFTERYDGGGSRDFIGYWRLINVNGAWLLDEPHY